MVLGGARDKGAPPEILAEAAAAIPGARHTIIPEAGHISAMENHDAFVSELRGFLKDLA